MQDIEFTIQQGKLWMLQTRSGKRTGLCRLADRRGHGAEEADRQGGGPAARRARSAEPAPAPDLRSPGEDARPSTEASSWPRASTPARARPAGKVVFNAPERGHGAGQGERQVLLVRIETSPEDIHGMNAAQGILTARGGMTSHAALVARGMGKVCVAGCGALNIDYKKRQMKVDGHTIKEGDLLSIDGTTGEVILGQLPTSPSEILQVLIEKKPQTRGIRDLPVLRQAHGLGRRGPPPWRAHQCRHAPTRPRSPLPSGPRASASAAPSTCSSKATGSTPSGR